MSHNVGRGSYDSIHPSANLSDASENDFETGAPVSRTRRSVLPTLGELTPRQRKLAVFSGVAAVALIGFGAVMTLGSGGDAGAHAAGDSADAPVSEPAPPPVPVVAPRLAEAPASPMPSASAAPRASSSQGELDEEQKKKDKKKRVGTVAPAGPAGNPDYGI
jgi:hypothetical protein